MNTHTSRRRLGFAVAGGLVVGCAAAAIAVAGVTDPAGRSTTVAPTDQSDVAVWVDGSGLVGLSPASLRLAERVFGPVDQSSVAEWADSTGSTGSSPTALKLSDKASPAVDQSAIERWADSRGLVGLSPASLRPASD